MFLAGDEFGNTQFGNNNAYCHDNKISWLDWSLLDKNRDLFEFFQYMIWFRKMHRIIRVDTQMCSLNYPFISQHGLQPFWPDYNSNHHFVGIMYAGRNRSGEDELVYIAINAYWNPQTFTVPQAPEGRRFYVVIDTYKEQSVVQDIIPVLGPITIMPRTVMVLETYPIIDHS